MKSGIRSGVEPKTLDPESIWTFRVIRWKCQAYQPSTSISDRSHRNNELFSFGPYHHPREPKLWFFSICAIKIRHFGDFSGDPVVKTLPSNAWECWFDPWSGNKDPTCHVVWPIKRKRKKKIFFSFQIQLTLNHKLTTVAKVGFPWLSW